MFVDDLTRRDLDVFSSSTPNGPSVFSLLNRTATRKGKELLRRAVATPCHDAETILELQAAQKILAAHALRYRISIDRTDPDAVETYLDSKWQLPSVRPWYTSAMLRIWPSAWYREYLREVARGQTRIVVFFDGVRALSQELLITESSALRRIGGRITDHLCSAHAQELTRLATVHSTSARLAFDELARSRGKKVVEELLDCVGTLEAWWSLAVATLDHGWCYPCPSRQFSVRGLIHPFLAPEAVPNELQLDSRTRVCFVTGPNMAGKSTFLKAVAVAVLLAHIGCGVPAVSMEFPVVGTLFCGLQVFENLSAGESLYLAEVRRIRALASALRSYEAGIAVIDEPFHGTNVHDAAEATLAVISRLLMHERVVVFVASHLVEIVPTMVHDPRIRLLHFAAHFEGERPLFDYRLREGTSTQRLGMKLLQQEHVLDLLEEAAATSSRAKR
jgi:DNA mismatch repair protein MutS